MATINQDSRWNQAAGSGIVLRFFDAHTPPRPAKIDVSDRQPTIVASDPTVLTPSNIVVGADFMSLTFDLDVGAEGIASLAVDVDVNLANGTDDSLVSRSEDVTVTPGPAGPAVTGAFSFPAPTPKP